MNKLHFLLLPFLLVGGRQAMAQQKPTGHTALYIPIHSSAFKQDSTIPVRYTCQGESISPALSWDAGAAHAKSLALVCEDPDAPRGTFVHWVMYNIPPTEKGLAENIPLSATLPNGTQQGLNGAKKVGYTGPCPPAGKAHRYYFRLYALDKMLTLSGDVTRATLTSAMEGHLLGMGELMGRYQRSN